MAKLFGADNPAYRGGVTELRSHIRNSKMYRDWKDLILMKDRYTCKMCGIKGTPKTLEVHHNVREFADMLQDFLAKYSQYSLPKDLRRLILLSQAYAPFWSMRNGIVYCKECHRKFHADEKLAKEGKSDV